MPTKLSQIGEFGFIDLIRKQMGSSGKRVRGIGDDTAVVPSLKNKKLLLTTDMFLEGVHFSRRTPAKAIGHKAMAANLSDIAAMGGVPKYALVAMGVSGSLKWKYLRQIYEGMNKTAKEFGVEILGGDTVQSNKIIINVSLIGEAQRHELLTRCGAKKGDQIFVTGRLGRSLQSGWHLRFKPRIEESRYLVKKFKPTSMIDISDGLAADLGHILKESKVGAVIYEDKIPRRGQASLKNALYDGEDFELIFTLSHEDAKRIKRQKKY